MGFFNFGKKANKPVETEVEVEAPKKVNLAKEERVTRINLRKEEVKQVCAEIAALNGTKARVALVLDYSGSMSSYYKDGTVQEVIEQMLPLAMQFDDDGNMETWIFDDSYHRLPDINLNNFYNYVKNEIHYSMGGTNYAPVMKDIYKRYIKEEPVPIADYIIFITDGDNADATVTAEFMKEVSKEPIFWQFVGIGNSTFRFLEKLDDMHGRYVDNADFFKVTDPSAITYRQLLNEFPSWLTNKKVQDMINKR